MVRWLWQAVLGCLSLSLMLASSSPVPMTVSDTWASNPLHSTQEVDTIYSDRLASYNRLLEKFEQSHWDPASIDDTLKTLSNNLLASVQDKKTVLPKVHYHLESDIKHLQNLVALKKSTPEEKFAFMDQLQSDMKGIKEEAMTMIKNRHNQIRWSPPSNAKIILKQLEGLQQSVNSHFDAASNHLHVQMTNLVQSHPDVKAKLEGGKSTKAEGLDKLENTHPGLPKVNTPKEGSFIDRSVFGPAKGAMIPESVSGPLSLFLKHSDIKEIDTTYSDRLESYNRLVEKFEQGHWDPASIDATLKKLTNENLAALQDKNILPKKQYHLNAEVEQFQDLAAFKKSTPEEKYAFMNRLQSDMKDIKEEGLRMIRIRKNELAWSPTKHSKTVSQQLKALTERLNANFDTASRNLHAQITTLVQSHSELKAKIEVESPKPLIDEEIKSANPSKAAEVKPQKDVAGQSGSAHRSGSKREKLLGGDTSTTEMQLKEKIPSPENPTAGGASEAENMASRAAESSKYGKIGLGILGAATLVGGTALLVKSRSKKETPTPV